jgi:DNA-binding Lrp family transcriptional regulator
MMTCNYSTTLVYWNSNVLSRYCYQADKENNRNFLNQSQYYHLLRNSIGIKCVLIVPISTGSLPYILRMQLQIIILSIAYVLILLDYDYPDNEVMSQLNMLPSVVEVNKVEGPYDIVVKLSDDDMSVLKESIGKYMIRIRGIQSTLTLMEE